MDQTDWKIISTLYKEKNITKAAAKLFISQPALSYRIKQIEEELDVLLVKRKKQGVIFTKEGEEVAAYANEMILKLYALKKYIKKPEKEISGTVKLGIARTFDMQNLAAIIKQYNEMYSIVIIKINIHHSNRLIELIDQKQLDACIIRGNFITDHIKHIIQSDNVYVYYSKEIDLNKLPEIPYICRMIDTNFKTMIEDWWKEKYNESPKPMMTVNNSDVARKLIMSGLGFTIWPEIKHIDIKYLTKQILKDKKENPLIWETSLIYRKDSYQIFAIKSFIDLFIHNY